MTEPLRIAFMPNAKWMPSSWPSAYWEIPNCDKNTTMSWQLMPENNSHHQQQLIIIIIMYNNNNPII